MLSLRALKEVRDRVERGQVESRTSRSAMTRILPRPTGDQEMQGLEVGIGDID